MKNLTVRRVTPDEVASSPEFERLTRQYFDECGNKAYDGPMPTIDQYRDLHKSGALHVSGLFDGSALVGFVCVLLVNYMHFSKPCASVESIYLDPAFRATRGGFMLFEAARGMAKELGAVGLYLSAPVGSRLDRIARAKRWRQTDSVFFIDFE